MTDSAVENHLKEFRLNVLKAKFEKEYGVSAEEAYKVANQGVADASGAIRKFGISILSDDRKWEEKE
nr:toxin PIN [Enterococcus lactis]